MRYDLNKIPKIDKTVCIPAEEYEARARNLRRQMDEMGVDIGIAYGTPHMPGDIVYLCGYDAQLENTIILVSQDKLYVLVGPEGYINAVQNCKYGEIRPIKEMQIPLEDYPITPMVSVAEILAEMFPTKKPKRAGILTKDDVMTTGCLELMRKNLDPSVDFIDASDILYYDLRFYKSVNEQNVLRVSNRICGEAVKAMVESVEPGMTELEVTAVGDYVMKSMGAACYGFDSFLLSGPRIDCIIGRGSNKVIQPGEMVSIGASCRYEGYASTARRMVIAGGEPTKGQREFLEHGIKAHLLSVEKFFYGGAERDVDLAARNYFRSVGFG